MGVDKIRGGLCCALAMMLVGSSFPASSLLLHYPYAGGQAIRYALGALILLRWPSGAVRRHHIG
ncbi:hypothetical protein [Fodinicola feengrottensis]|uniref:hypothetical protein n=1 Tax=Fodinicola feengrottensis TaxID=435914 RepID=UPI0013D0E748|nr:hypothetical protein [Fodinicola feengrottensis]